MEYRTSSTIGYVTCLDTAPGGLQSRGIIRPDKCNSCVGHWLLHHLLIILRGWHIGVVEEVYWGGVVVAGRVFRSTPVGLCIT